jgi:hypothetical protein
MTGVQHPLAQYAAGIIIYSYALLPTLDKMSERFHRKLPESTHAGILPQWTNLSRKSVYSVSRSPLFLASHTWLWY